LKRYSDGSRPSACYERHDIEDALHGATTDADFTPQERAILKNVLGLHDVRVADVMTPDPDLAAGWLTVAEFVRQLGSWPPQAAFPVIGPDGRLASIVTIRRLSRVPAQSQPQVRLRQLAVPVPAESLASPADPAAPLLTRDPLGGEVVAVVEHGGRIAGMVTTENMRQVLRLRKLGDVSGGPGSLTPPGARP